MRRLYKTLVLMHPPIFRDRFASEMLWIFEECGESGVSLCCDCFISVLRQWLLRSGSWKLVPALFGAFLQVTAGGLIWLMISHSHGSAGAHRSAYGVQLQGSGELRNLMQLTLWLVGGMLVLVTGAALWLKAFIAKRSSRT